MYGGRLGGVGGGGGDKIEKIISKGGGGRGNVENRRRDYGLGIRGEEIN